MTKIFQKLQDSEDEHASGYTLKSNIEIINIICDFGNGETEFHTIDIERLIRENEKMKELLDNIIRCQYDSNLPLSSLNGAVSNAKDFFDIKN